MVTSSTPASSVDPALSALLASATLSSGGESERSVSADTAFVEVDVSSGESKSDFLASLEAAVGGSGVGTADVSPLQVKVASVRKLDREEKDALEAMEGNSQSARSAKEFFSGEMSGDSRFNKNLVFLGCDIDRKCCGNVGRNSEK